MKEKTPAEQVQDALTLVGRLFVQEQDARLRTEDDVASLEAQVNELHDTIDRLSASYKAARIELGEMKTQTVQPRFKVGDTVFVRPPLDQGVQRTVVLYVEVKTFEAYSEVVYGFRSIGAFAAGRVFATAEEAFGG